MIVFLPAFHFIEIALVFEILLIVLAMILSVFLHMIFRRIRETDVRVKARLKGLIMKWAMNEEPFDYEKLKSKGVNLPRVVSVLKSLEEKFNDEHFEEIKEKALDFIVQRQVNKYLHSSRWLKRAFALQALGMMRSRDYEHLILPFLNDPIPVVRIAAVVCSVKQQTPEAINRVLDAMHSEESFARFPYRDELLGGGAEVFSILQERLRHETRPGLRACCLEIISQKIGYVNFDLIKEDFDSENKTLRWWAVRSLENYPSDESVQQLMKSAEDAHWEIQALAVRCLGMFGLEAAIPTLKEKLSSDQWLVRLNAALGLRQIGQKGVEVLKSINVGLAGDVSQYVLALPDTPLGGETIKWFDMNPKG